MAKWIQVQGQMASAEIESFVDGDGDERYRPKVSYSYLIDGRQYYGDRFYRMDFSYSGPDTIEKDLQKFSPGSAITVYVNPADPTDSFLDNTSLMNDPVVMLMFTLFGALLIGMIVLVIGDWDVLWDELIAFLK